MGSDWHVPSQLAMAERASGEKGAQKADEPERTLECRECGKTLFTSRGYWAHMNQHAGKRPFKCTLCPKSYPSANSLNTHIKRLHKLSQEAKNPLTKSKSMILSSSDTTSLEKARKKTSLLGKFQCGLCGQILKSLVSYKKHLKKHIMFLQAGRSFKPHKNKSTSSRIVDRHKAPGHKGSTVGIIEPERKCCYCSKVFQTATNARIHEKRSHGPCSKCGRALSCSSHLKAHLNLHAGKRPYKCSHCPKAFCGPKAVYQHEKRVHLAMMITKGSKGSATHSLNTQVPDISAHSTREAKRKSKMKNRLCGKGSGSVKSLKVHPKYHVKASHKFKCSYCSRDYYSVKSLNVHLKAKHSLPEEETTREKSIVAANSHPFQKTSQETEDTVQKKQNLKCTCGYFKLDQLDYVAHINIHAGDQPSKCPRCQYASCSSQTLKLNIEWKHQSKQQRFLCKYCGCVLSNARNYDMHCKQHAGITPYKCSQCSCSFHSNKGLYLHRKKCGFKKTKKQRQTCAPKSHSTKQQNVQEGTRQQNQGGNDKRGEEELREEEECGEEGEQRMEELRGKESLRGDEGGRLSSVAYEKVTQNPKYPLPTDRSLTMLSDVDKSASLQCGLCGMVLATYTMYMAHMSIHGEKSSLQNQTSPIDPSNSTQHPESKPYTQNPICIRGKYKRPFKCTMCWSAYAKSKTLIRHMKLMHPTQSMPPSFERGDYALPSNRYGEILRMPQVEKKPLTNLQFHCAKYSKAYEAKSSLQSHYWKKHLCRMPKTQNRVDREPQEAGGTKSCANQLGKKLPSSQLQPFLCQSCSKAFASRQSLMNHIRLNHFHSPQEKMKTRSSQLPSTKKCEDTQARDSVKSQVSSDGEPKSKDEEPQTRDDEEMQAQKVVKLKIKKYSFTCSKCPKVFGSRVSLFRHMRLSHSILPPISRWTRRCSQLYQAGALPNDSFSAEQLPFLCGTPECNVSLALSNTDHPGTSSSDGSTLTPTQHNTPDHELSDSIFPSLPHKSSHLSSQKSRLEQDQLICPFCDKHFRLMPQFCWHIFGHKQLQPFSCSVCHEQYSSILHLKKHQNTHLGNKSICCSLCWQFQSTSSHRVLTHILETHEQQLQQKGLSLPHCLAESEQQPAGGTQPHREELCAVSEGAESSPVCGVGMEHSSVCGMGVEQSSVCGVGAESSSVCGVGADSSSVCGVGVEPSCMYEVVEMGGAGEDVGGKQALTFASCGGCEGGCEVWGEEVPVCGEVQIRECPSPAESSPAPAQADTVVVKYGNWDVFFFKNSSSKD